MNSPGRGVGSAGSVVDRSGSRSPSEDSEEEGSEEEESGPQSPPKQMAEKTEKPAEGPSSKTVRLSHQLTALLRHGRVGGKRLPAKDLLALFDTKGWVRGSTVVELLGLSRDGAVEAIQAACDCSHARLETGRTKAGTFMVRARHSWSIDHVYDGLDPVEEVDEPKELFHGTSWRAWGKIAKTFIEERAAVERRDRKSPHSPDADAS